MSILGFKYSEGQIGISLSPPKGVRKIAFLMKNDADNQQFDTFDGKFQWKQVMDPFHDSNKLYAMYRAVPSSSWIEFPSLEDLGIESEPFSHPFSSLESVIASDKISYKSFIGSGWIAELDCTVPTSLLVILRDTVNNVWKVRKLEITKPDLLISDPKIFNLSTDIQFDLIIPVVQPKRIESSKGVYFVG